MPFFFKKNQSKISTILFVVFVFVALAGSLAPVYQAQSSHIPGEENDHDAPGAPDEPNAPASSECGISNIKACIIEAIESVTYGVYYILGQVLSFELNILSWVMNALDWNNDIVILGWGIVRDVANLFFILVIMIIAFATVLQLESYGMKALLPRLIFIALLMNFSLVICGFLINFSNSLGNTFVKAGGGGSNFTARLANGLGITNVSGTNASDDAEIKKNIEQNISQSGSEKTFLTVLLTLAMSIMASLIMMFVMGAAIFFLAVRQISLMFIVILSPIALIGLLLPFLGEHWAEWKKAFIKWLTFYPTFMFFFYVAVKILESKNVMFSGAGISSKVVGFSGVTSPQALWKLFFASAFLIGAFQVAQKASVAGAGAIGKFGTSSLKTITGVGAAMRAGKAVKERVKEETSLRRAQLASRLAPTATMRREAELRAGGIEKKREKDFARLVEHKTDPTTGKVVLTDKGKYLAEKYANNPTSRYHKMSVKALAGKWEPTKPKPLSAEDIERLEKKLSEKIS